MGLSGTALWWLLLLFFLSVHPANTAVQSQQECRPDCPPFSHCSGHNGTPHCHCDLGFYFDPVFGCVIARTFPARVSLSALMWDPNNLSAEPNVSAQFQGILGNIEGYLSTSVSMEHWDGGSHVTVLHHFSTFSAVTEQMLNETVSLCPGQDGGCAVPLPGGSYQVLSLCDFAPCDPLSSLPQCHRGLVTCPCRLGYYKFSSGDRACTVCTSGFHWEDSSCQRCPFGFTGFNCDEPFLLSLVVQSGLLCLLVAACVSLLILYSRRKKSQRPKLFDIRAPGLPSDQRVLSLPRAQFSWRRDWKWDEPAGNALGETGESDHIPEPSDIQLKTFQTPRSTVSDVCLGSHNLGFIGDCDPKAPGAE